MEDAQSDLVLHLGVDVLLGLEQHLGHVRRLLRDQAQRPLIDRAPGLIGHMP
ncbi:MAG: hypothetical protein ACI8QZ_001253 [Chlamydiales bacterium]|jgi:hypothetical protein